MSEQIEQGDYIYFQDTTVGGPPVLWKWNFPGGSPTGGTAPNPVVRYLGPNASGFGVTLYVEDQYSVSSSKTENNIIVVLPENLNSVSITSSPSRATMSQPVTYTAAGPTGKLSYYEWILPGTGGFTGASSQTETVSSNSWLALTGTEVGAVYSTFPVKASLAYYSILGNSAIKTTTVTFVKCGQPESFNFLGGGTFPGATAEYIKVSASGQTSEIGLPGGGYVFLITQPLAPEAIEIASSHVQGEFIDFWSASKDIVFNVPGHLYDLNYVASETAFNALGLDNTGWGSLGRYKNGNYMFPGDLGLYFSSEFYVGDVRNLTNTTLINDLIGLNNFITLFFDDAFYASQSSVSITGSDILPAAYILGLDGADGAYGVRGLQCIPSKKLVGSDIILTLTVENSIDGTPDGYQPGADNVINIVISDDLNPSGNSPDASLFFAQDTERPGYVSIINTALANAGFSGNIEAFASPKYCFEPKIYSSTIGNYFQGMKIVIKDMSNPRNGLSIIRVKIEGNENTWESALNKYPMVGGDVGNWLGFRDQYISNPYQDVYSGQAPFRGFIFRGDT